MLWFLRGFSTGALPIQVFSFLGYKLTMRLQFQVRSGSSSGQLFEVAVGAVIGRAASANISLTDRKISGRHAQVELDGEGRWMLKDLGSTNGLRVNSQRVKEIHLEPGLIFRAGNTMIEVIEARESDPSPSPLPPPPPPAKDKILSWSEYLTQFAQRAHEKVRNQPQSLVPFDPLLVLTVVRGLQAGTQWVLGYGPREIGLDTLEFNVLDAPALAFRVTPRDGLAFYETAHPKEVRLNGSSPSAETLHDGDEIQISDTIIKVSYKE